MSIADFQTVLSTDGGVLDLQALSDLYTAMGWNAQGLRSAERLRKMLEISSFYVAVYDEMRLVGFGRILSDGFVCQLLDIITHPDFRRRGIGSAVMARLMEHVEAYHPYAMLVDGSGVSGFYEKYGFFDAGHEERVMYWEKNPAP